MVLADVLKKWNGFTNSSGTYLTTGTDEHGNKVDQAASKAGVPTKQFVDSVSETFLKLANLAEIKYDRFIRTTDKDHIAASQSLFRILQENGFIYKGKHMGWYCVSDETFYPESQVEKRVDADTGHETMVSVETGKQVEWTSEENYFFALSRFREPLLKHFRSRPDFVLPKVRHEALIRELENGLDDLSVSRPAARCSWGIPVPGDDSQVMYVWLDALTNYLTSAGYPWPSQKSRDSSVWPADAHVVGKDIVRFHAIYWPAFLLAAGIPVPRQVIVHSHWTMEGSKMSKSTGNVVDPETLASIFGIDSLKFFLMNDAHLDHDSAFSIERIEERHNVLIVNKYGNLVARVCGAKFNIARSLSVNAADVFATQEFSFRDAHERFELLRSKVDSLVSNVDASMKLGEPSRALAAVWDVLSSAQAFVQDTEPWSLKGSQNAVLQDAVIQAGSEAARVASIVLLSFIPNIAGGMLDRLAVNESRRRVDYAKYGADTSYGEGANRKGGHVVKPVAAT